MNKKNNIIEINGKQYNTDTGELVVAKVKKAKKLTVGQNLDGVNTKPLPSFGITPLSSPNAAPASIQLPILTKDLTSQSVMDIKRKPAKIYTAHQPQASKTLMRRAVKKPTSSFKRQIKSQTAANYLPTTTTSNDPLTNQFIKDHSEIERLHRANEISRNKLVKKFNPQTESSSLSPFNSDQVMSRQFENPSIKTPKTGSLNNSHTSSLSNPYKSTKDEIFEKAIARATSHEQLPVKPAKQKLLKSRKKVTSFLTAFSVLLIGSFIIYSNLNNINLYVDGLKAGFKPTLPSYNPSGYGLNKLTAASNIVSANYRSQFNNQKYSIVEQPSTWDSPTLQDSFVKNIAGNNYQTINTSDLTIYLYGQSGNNNATWVNGGLWYRLYSHSSLTNNQIIQIANSL